MPVALAVVRYKFPGREGLTAFFLSPTPPMPVFDLPEPDRRALAVLLLARHP